MKTKLSTMFLVVVLCAAFATPVLADGPCPEGQETCAAGESTPEKIDPPCQGMNSCSASDYSYTEPSPAWTERQEVKLAEPTFEDNPFPVPFKGMR